MPNGPEGTVRTAATAARLSTLRLPRAWPEGLDRTLVALSGYFRSDDDALWAALANRSVDARACVERAPLACASGVEHDTCLSDRRRCAGVDDLARNARDPFVDLYARPPRGHHVVGLEVRFPAHPQLRDLARGAATLELYAPRDEPVPCARGGRFDVSAEELRALADGWLLLSCLDVEIDDAALLALARVVRARLTLLGERRQLWLEGVRFVHRDLTALGLRDDFETTDAHPPVAPPWRHPPAPASHLFVTGMVVHPRSLVRAAHPRGCDLNVAQCAARVAPYWLFEQDDAGCCDALELAHANLTWATVPKALAAQLRWFGRVTPRAGLGALHADQAGAPAA